MSLSTIEWGLVIVFSAVWGSFLNMLIYRLPRELPIGNERSQCIHCKHTLHAKDLIPVLSYLFQLGRCRYCKKYVTIRYFIVELITILATLFTVSTYGFTALGLQFFAFYTVMILLFFIDLETYILPDSLTIGMLIAGLAIAAKNGVLLHHAYAAIIGFSVYGLIQVIGKWVYKQDAMGSGDLKLGAAIGAMFGIKIVLIAQYLSFILGGIIALTCIGLKIKKKSDIIPFGPAIILAVLIAQTYHQQIWTYFFP